MTTRPVTRPWTTSSHENHYSRPNLHEARDRHQDRREVRRQVAFEAAVFRWDAGAA